MEALESVDEPAITLLSLTIIPEDMGTVLPIRTTNKNKITIIFGLIIFLCTLLAWAIFDPPPTIRPSGTHFQGGGGGVQYI